MVNDNGGTRARRLQRAREVGRGGRGGQPAGGQRDRDDLLARGRRPTRCPPTPCRATRVDDRRLRGQRDGHARARPGAQTCTITANDVAPTLTVVKQVVNDNGGTRAPGDFSLHVKRAGADVAGSPAAGTASGRTYTLAAGTYAVSEDAVAGYLGTISGACAADGTVTLKEGDAKTCTITQRRPRAGRLSAAAAAGGRQGRQRAAEERHGQDQAPRLERVRPARPRASRSRSARSSTPPRAGSRSSPRPTRTAGRRRRTSTAASSSSARRRARRRSRR